MLVEETFSDWVVYFVASVNINRGCKDENRGEAGA